MTIVEKAAYLKGLTEGLGVDPDSRDGKLWSALNDLLSDMAHEIEDLQATSMDHAEVIDDICEDLRYLEKLADELGDVEGFEDFDEFEDFEGDDEDDKVYALSDFGRAHDFDEDAAEDEEGEDEEVEYDGVMYDVTCPSCGEDFEVDEDTLLDGGVECPACGEHLEFDFDEDDEIEDAE